jgi:hypothetical protein
MKTHELAEQLLRFPEHEVCICLNPDNDKAPVYPIQGISIVSDYYKTVLLTIVEGEVEVK